MKILIIQQRYGIGDLIIFLPYIHAISKKFKTKVSLLVKESSKASDLLSNDKNIDEILILDKDKDGIKGFFKLSNEIKDQDLGIHYIKLNKNRNKIIDKDYIFLNERVRDMIISNDKKIIIIFLETTSSLAVLKKTKN